MISKKEYYNKKLFFIRLYETLFENYIVSHKIVCNYTVLDSIAECLIINRRVTTWIYIYVFY